MGLTTLPTPFKIFPVAESILLFTPDFWNFNESVLICFLNAFSCSKVKSSNFIPGFVWPLPPNFLPLKPITFLFSSNIGITLLKPINFLYSFGNFLTAFLTTDSPSLFNFFISSK